MTVISVRLAADVAERFHEACKQVGWSQSDVLRKAVLLMLDPESPAGGTPSGTGTPPATGPSAPADASPGGDCDLAEHDLEKDLSDGGLGSGKWLEE